MNSLFRISLDQQFLNSYKGSGKCLLGEEGGREGGSDSTVGIPGNLFSYLETVLASCKLTGSL